jgi:hypothetical protein
MNSVAQPSVQAWCITTPDSDPLPSLPLLVPLESTAVVLLLSSVDVVPPDDPSLVSTLVVLVLVLVPGSVVELDDIVVLASVVVGLVADIDEVVPPPSLDEPPPSVEPAPPQPTITKHSTPGPKRIPR